MHFDEIMDEQVLFNPDELADMAESSVTRTADGWIQCRDTGLTRFIFKSPDGFDIEPFDTISVSLRVDAPEWRLSSMMQLDTMDPGSNRADRYHVGTCGPRTVQGEFRFDLPIENWHRDGFPQGWKGIIEFSLHVSAPLGGSIEVGPVLKISRKRVDGPRITDQDLFYEYLDLDYPGMESVRECVERKDMKSARAALLEHLKQRTDVMEDLDAVPSSMRLHGIVGYADDFMRGVFQGQKFGNPVDWRINPNGYLEWCHAFNRHYCLAALFQAWRNTGRESYMKALDDALEKWIRISPEPTGMNDGGGDPAWETLSVAVRVDWAWLPIFFGTLEAPGIRDETRIDMFKSLIAQAEHLVKWQGGASNWLIVESQALAMCGMLFPEVVLSKKWFTTGMKRLEKLLNELVWPDGVEMEIAPGYHWMSGCGFADAMALALRLGIKCPEKFRTVIGKMTEYHLFLRRPDGTLPSINDSGDVNGKSTAAISFGAEYYGRSDMKWALSKGAEGKEPSDVSYAFKDAGIYVMRTNWKPDANWLLFRGGNIGLAHCHEDRLSLELCAGGRHILVDPGSASYKVDELRAWSVSSSGHNTVTIDGHGQRQRPQPLTERTASVRKLNFWKTNKNMDVAAARYVGAYGSEQQLTGISHQREIHFMKPHFWVMADMLQGQGRHTANMLFHFIPMVVRISTAPMVIRTCMLAHPNLEILPVNWPSNSVIRQECGSLDPVQGWISLQQEWTPSPCVTADVPFKDRALLLTLLVPLTSGLVSGFTVQENKDEARWSITTPREVYEISVLHKSFRSDSTRVTPMIKIDRM